MNYPNKKTTLSFKNRGMNLEEDINLTNKYYLDNNIALIYKKPTPIKATKIDYRNSKKIITEGYFETPSTTDYNGIYNGMYIDFEAKETKNKTSFPLSNIHQHQIKHLKNVELHGGLSFIIIRFTTLNETYLIKINEVLKLETKSIPLSYIKENGYLIKENYQPRLDYLKIISQIKE